MNTGHCHSAPIKVLFYLTSPAGGIARYTHELLTQFASSESVQAELICPESYLWSNAAAYSINPRLLGAQQANIICRRASFLMGQILNPRQLVRRAVETGAEIVHLSNINHLSFPLWRRWWDSSPTILAATAHDIRRTKAIFHRPYEDDQLQAFYRRADLLFVHSRTQAEDLIAFAGVIPERIQVVPHGPYPYGASRGTQAELRQRLGWPMNKQIALFFGTIRDDKNLGLLIRALPRFAQRIHLVVAGRGAGAVHKGIAYYQELAASLNISSSVTFMDGFIPEQDVPDLFVASDWIVLPYSREFTSQSGVLNIAAAYHRPVLVSAAGTFEETLRQSRIGHLVEPDDQQALEMGLAKMIAAIREGEQFDFSSYLEHFSWRENVRRTIAAYNKALSRQTNF